NAGKRRIGAGKSGIALLALRSGVPVYPAYIEDGPQTSNLLRAWLKPSRVRVIFGAPLDLSRFQNRTADRRLLEEATAHIMQRIAQLRFHEKKDPRDIKL